jgi:excisionase family DNA binding protein
VVVFLRQQQMEVRPLRDLKVSEAARQLTISLDAVYRLLYAGKLEARKKNGRWVIEQSAVEKRLKEKKEKYDNCNAR